MTHSNFYNYVHQRVPINKLEIPQDLSNFQDEIKQVLEQNPYYAKQLMKKVVDSYPEDEDLNEWLYETYCTMMSVGKPDPTTKDIIRYSFNKDTRISIEETPYIICAQGTTGFRTWEAALYLTAFLLENPEYVQGKKVVELGCGTGVVGIAIEQLASHVVLTDGDSALIQQLSVNLALNNSQCSAQRLWWGEDLVPDCDILVAADVTYDSTVIPSLLQCIKDGLTGDCHTALVSATVRNTDTLEVFHSECDRIGLSYDVLCKDMSPLERSGVWYGNVICDIRIYQLRKI